MNSTARNLCVLVSLICVLQILNAKADAATPYLLYECASAPSSCDTKADMYSDWNQVGNTPYGTLPIYYYPTGTVVLMASAYYPISAAFEVVPVPGFPGLHMSQWLTNDDLASINLDNRLHARAAKLDPINIPASVADNAGNAQWEIVQEYIQQHVLIPTGPTGESVFHGLTHLNIAKSVWVQFEDVRDGTLHDIWSTDQIKVVFHDKSTAQLYLDPHDTAQTWFHVVTDSERDPNGNPYSSQSVGSASSLGGTFNFVAPADWTAGSIYELLYQAYCEVTTETCATGDAQACSIRKLIVPCP